MEKIIKFVALKKFLWSLILFTFLFQLIIPTFAAEVSGGEVEKTYKEWMSLWNNVSSSNFDKDLTKIEQNVKDYIINKLGRSESLVSGMLAKEENQKIIMIKADYKYESGTGTTSDKALLKITEFNINEIYIEGKKDEGINGVNALIDGTLDEEIEDNDGSDISRIKKEITYDELKECLGNPDESTLDSKIIKAVKDGLYTTTFEGDDYANLEAANKNLFNDAAESLVKKKKRDMLYTVRIYSNSEGEVTFYEVLEVILPGENLKDAIEEERKLLAETKNEDSATLGGILLSPVFYLINFFADAIMSNVGNIMMGDGLSLISGTSILSTNKIVPDATMKTTPYEVSVKSFKKNFLGGLTAALTDAPAEYQYPNIEYTPEKIFSGEIELLSIDFISGKIAQRDDKGQLIKDENGNVQYAENSDEGWMNIRAVISQWYQVLRMIAIIGLLSVLIYTGIKIILSSTAKDKAKYKEWIGNWFMAAGILFFMHFIMAFIISVTGEFSLLISDSCQQIAVNVVDGEQPDSFVTNLTGLVRFMIQSENFYIKVGYEVMYIALIFYTIKFTVIYLKRVLNMAFLTLIAPIVALTYPIDKINDGKAQGFEMWVKEYIYNALLQPMHQILYYILLGTAVGVAASNPIYGIVVLGFMTQAEKLLKDIFGFKKAGGGTVGGMTSAFAAGAIASNIKNIARMASGAGGKGGKDGSGSDANGIYDNPKPNGIDAAEDDKLFMGASQNSGDNSNNQTPPSNSQTGDNSQQTSNNNNQASIENDRKLLDELEAEGAKGDNKYAEGKKWTDEDYKAFDELEAEQLEKEEKAKQAQEQQQQQQQASQKPIHEMKTKKDEEKKPKTDEELKAEKKARHIKGMKNIRNRAIKPIWDVDRTKKENVKRLTRKVARAGLGAAIGIGAAAVQAGISITDGKYNPAEGIATFAAGYAGAGQIFKGAERIGDIYREGRDEGDKKAIIDGARERWADRDDVIKYNKKYKPEEREHVMKIQKELLGQGVTDIKEMDKCIKFMKESGKFENHTEADIRRARVGHDVSEQLSNYGINPHKSDDVDKFIETQTKHLTGQEQQRQATILRNKIDCARQYRDAIYKKG